ncbi:MAG: glycosyltransferase family 39 protein [Anaerolineae bacterium]|nr:glycosyltransferase family 39 protein [Anaerolineae bacterium]
MSHYRSLWIALLLLATALRLPYPDWDAMDTSFAIAAHPDERFLLGVAQATPLWGDPCDAAPGFAYGHLPVYLARLLVVAAPEADPLYAARLFSGLVGVLLVVLAGAFGRTLGGRRAALFAAAIMAVAPFPIQQARFYTVDPLGTAFASVAVLLAMRCRWKMAGALAGLAISCKISLVWVLLPILFAALCRHELRVTNHQLQVTNRRPAVFRIIYTLLSTSVVFALVSPWSLLRPITAWQGPWTQVLMAAGRYDFPYTRQYAGTWPYLYPLVQMALWGLGPAATLAGLAGLLRVSIIWRSSSSSFVNRCVVLSEVRCTCFHPFQNQVAWLWTVSYFLATAGLYVKFPRYLLPIYPVWVAWGIQITDYGLRITNHQLRTCTSHIFSSAFSFLLFILTLPLGLAQVSIYGQLHPWIAASQWLYGNVLPGEVIAVEAWDHPLPVPLSGEESEHFMAAVQQVILPIFDADSPGKTAQLAEAAREVDVIVLASRRGYGAVSRHPDRYADTLAWYREAFAQRERIIFTRCPRLGPIAFVDDPLWDITKNQVLPDTAVSLANRCDIPFVLRLPRLDESFRVYDAPLVIILVKKPGFF